MNPPPRSCSAKASRAHVLWVLGYKKEKMYVQVCRRPTPLSRLCHLAVVGTLSFALTIFLDYRIAGQVEIPYVPLLGSLTLGLILLVRLYTHARRLEQAVAQQSQGLAGAAGESAPAQETQPASEASYRLLFDNNPQPMWVFDLDTLAFLAVNDAAVAHYGYTRDEFLAMTIKDLHTSEEVPALLSYLAHHATEDRLVRVWQHRKKDGTPIDVEAASDAVTFAGHRA